MLRPNSDFSQPLTPLPSHNINEFRLQILEYPKTEKHIKHIKSTPIKKLILVNNFFFKCCLANEPLDGRS